jgi:hypothetical protein
VGNSQITNARDDDASYADYSHIAKKNKRSARRRCPVSSAGSGREDEFFWQWREDAAGGVLGDFTPDEALRDRVHT